MTRFAIVGAGWRAEFYLRIAALVPHFEVTSVMTSNNERRARVQSFGVEVVSSYDDLLKAKPDFVVASPSYAAVPEVIEALVDRDIPVLAETPPAPDLDSLKALWKAVGGARIQVAEQYPFQPEHAARLNAVQSGLLGKVSHVQVSHVQVSYAHGYHGVSLIRRYLGLSFEEANISAIRRTAPIIAGPGRDGPATEAKLIDAEQTLATLDFAGKWGVFDFSMEQYFSWIRANRVLIRSDKGEFNDKTLTYLLDYKTPATLDLKRWDLGHGGNLEGYAHKGITLGDKWLYTNPFGTSRLSDDEIAVATCLKNMADYVENGTSSYSLAEAMQDAYLAYCIEQAVTSKNIVTAHQQAWASAD